MEVRVLWKSTCVLPHIKTPSQLWFFVFTAMILLELLMSFWNLFVKPVRRTRIPAYPHIRISAYPHTRISAYPHIRIPAYPHTRISAYPHIRIPAYPHTRISAYPHIRVPAFSTKPKSRILILLNQSLYRHHGVTIYDNSKQEECSHLMLASLVYSKSVIECLLHCLLNIRDAFFCVITT